MHAFWTHTRTQTHSRKYYIKQLFIATQRRFLAPRVSFSFLHFSFCAEFICVCVRLRAWIRVYVCVRATLSWISKSRPKDLHTPEIPRESQNNDEHRQKERERVWESAHDFCNKERERERDEFALPACMSSADLQLQWKNKTKQQVNLNWSVLSFFYNFLFSSALTCANVFLPPFVPNPLVRNSKGQKRNVIVCLQEEEHKTPNAAEAKALLSSAERRQRASWTKWRSSVSPTPIKMNARGNPQKKEGKMRIRAFPVSANNIWI